MTEVFQLPFSTAWFSMRTHVTNPNSNVRTLTSHKKPRRETESTMSTIGQLYRAIEARNELNYQVIGPISEHLAVANGADDFLFEEAVARIPKKVLNSFIVARIQDIQEVTNLLAQAKDDLGSSVDVTNVTGFVHSGDASGADYHAYPTKDGGQDAPYRPLPANCHTAASVLQDCGVDPNILDVVANAAALWCCVIQGREPEDMPNYAEELIAQGFDPDASSDLDVDADALSESDLEVWTDAVGVKGDVLSDTVAVEGDSSEEELPDVVEAPKKGRQVGSKKWEIDGCLYLADAVSVVLPKDDKDEVGWKKVGLMLPNTRSGGAARKQWTKILQGEWQPSIAKEDIARKNLLRKRAKEVSAMMLKKHYPSVRGSELRSTEETESKESGSRSAKRQKTEGHNKEERDKKKRPKKLHPRKKRMSTAEFQKQVINLLGTTDDQPTSGPGVNESITTLKHDIATFQHDMADLKKDVGDILKHLTNQNN